MVSHSEQFDRTEFDCYFTRADSLSRHTLGRTAVMYENERVGNELRRDFSESEQAFDSARTQLVSCLEKAVLKAGSRRDAALDEEKTRLLDLSQEDRETLNAHIGDIAPAFFQRHYQMWQRDYRPPIRSRIIQKLTGTSENDTTDWISWLAIGASEEQRINFYQWHEHRLVSMSNSEEFKALVDEQKRVFAAGVRTGVDKSELPTATLDALDGLEDASVLFSDAMIGLLIGGTAVGGYVAREVTQSPHQEHYEAQRAAFVVEPTDPFESIEDRIEYVLVHELNHLLLGRLGPEWLNEALTEHIAQAMKRGVWHEISPFLRGDDGSYPWYRELLSVVLEPDKDAVNTGRVSFKDATFVPLWSLTDAYATHDPVKKRACEQTMRDYFTKAYGRGDIPELIEYRINEILVTLPGYSPNERMLRLKQEAAEILVDEWEDPEERGKLLARVPDLMPSKEMATSS